MKQGFGKWERRLPYVFVIIKGSGKSTSCSNIGYAMALLGYKVLLIDGDMQLNLSLSFFEEEKVLEMAKGRRICIPRSKTSGICRTLSYRRAMRVWISFPLPR